MIQEEEQQQHEQKLDRFEHGISRGHTTPGLDSLAASVSMCSETEKVLVQAASRRPDTAYEGGSLPADGGRKTTASSSNSQTLLNDFSTNTLSGFGTLQDVDGVTQQSDATLAAEKLSCRAQSSSTTLDRFAAGPEPPKKASGKVKPSPRPRQACKAFKTAATEHVSDWKSD